MALRSSWEGFLKLNLLSVPVKAYSTAISGRGKTSFHQLHADCGNRIKHQKVCPVHGEVSKDEIEQGYEYAKGQYIVIDDEELNAIRELDDKSIAIESFIHPDALDPVYCSGRSYYLTPGDKVGQNPYAVIQAVMSKQNRYAIAKVVFSGRQQLALIRPVEDLLVMMLLNFDEQIKKPAAFEDEAPPKSELSPKEIELAKTLIEASTDEKFDYSAYKDEYEAELTSLIEAKAKGKKIVAPRKHGEEPTVINLMDALRKSLQSAQKSGKKRPKLRIAPRTRKKTA